MFLRGRVHDKKGRALQRKEFLGFKSDNPASVDVKQNYYYLHFLLSPQHMREFFIIPSLTIHQRGSELTEH